VRLLTSLFFGCSTFRALDWLGRGLALYPFDSQSRRNICTARSSPRIYRPKGPSEARSCSVVQTLPRQLPRGAGPENSEEETGSKAPTIAVSNASRTVARRDTVRDWAHRKGTIHWEHKRECTKPRPHAVVGAGPVGEGAHGQGGYGQCRLHTTSR
jgi:hypothetical protein